MTKSFYSNGKLLITGEYGVLDGALSLAVPTKFGQSLSVAENNSDFIIWKSLDEKGEIWFEATLYLKNKQNNLYTDIATAETLIKILREAQKLNLSFLADDTGFTVTTTLDFPRNWGLGSSSTLINNIAQWAKVDPFHLLWNAFSGSGYDIACAMQDTPILYRLKNNIPEIQPIVFNPVFKEHIYFVHLNKKQNSREGISAYRKADFNKEKFISNLDELTKKINRCVSLSDFQNLIELHENTVGAVLGQIPVKQKYFQDYDGAIKSLGAWGGDFVMAVGSNATIAYFKKRGYSTAIPFSEMVL